MGHSHQHALDRRSFHRDIVATLIKTASALNAGMVVIAIYLVFRAQPISFAEVDANLGIRTTWDGRVLSYLFLLMVVGLLTGVGGLIANSARLKRRYDHLRKNFVLMAAASFTGIVFYLLF